jgi:hypothetical protein
MGNMFGEDAGYLNNYTCRSLKKVCPILTICGWDCCAEIWNVELFEGGQYLRL